MNVETRTLHNYDDLSDAERTSGKFIPVARKYARKYEPKQPVNDADFARIMAADERRQRRASKRLAAEARRG